MAVGLAAIAAAGVAAAPAAQSPSAQPSAAESPAVIDKRLYTAPQLRRNAALVLFRLDRPLSQRPGGSYRAHVVVDGQRAPVFAIAGEQQRPCYAAYLYGNDRHAPVRFRPGSRYGVRVVVGGRTRYAGRRALGGQPESAMQGGPLDC